MAEDAAVLLIVGGLLMLGLVVTLVLVRAIFPAGRPSQGDRFAGQQDRALVQTPSIPLTLPSEPRRLNSSEASRDEGRKAGRRIRPAFVDDVLSYVENQGWGSPRILRLLDHRAVIRYYDCNDCRVRAEGRLVVQECSFQAGYLEGAFSRLYEQPVRVRELACRRAGDVGCEFEVTS